jgi:hypothetical protein
MHLTISALEGRSKQSGVLQLEDQIFAVEGEDKVVEHIAAQDGA